MEVAQQFPAASLLLKLELENLPVWPAIQLNFVQEL